MLGLLIFFIILIVLSINEPVHATVIHSPNALPVNDSDVKATQMIWVNTTKTTGGWPLLKNDVYNTMGLELLTYKGNKSGFYVSDNYTDSVVGAGKWRIFFAVTSIASSRVKDTNKKTDSIKSQTLTLAFPKVKTFKDINPDVVGVTGLSSDAFESWPCKDPSPVNSISSDGDLNWSALYPEVISEMDNHTNFALLPSEFAKSQGGDMWISHRTGREMQQHLGTILIIDFPYSQDQDGNLSDCGYTYHIDYKMSAGKTQEFDVITNTDWGLFETSQVSMHIKITAPPSPMGMSKSELNKYGITPRYNKYGEIFDYLINTNNLSIEVS